MSALAIAQKMYFHPLMADILMLLFHAHVKRSCQTCTGIRTAEGAKTVQLIPGMKGLSPDSCFISGLLRHFCLDWSDEQRHQPTLSSLAQHTYEFQTEIKRFSLLFVFLFTCQGNIYDADIKIKINKVQFFNMSTDLLLKVGRLHSTFVTCQAVIFFGWCVFFSFSCLLPTSIDTFRPKFWRSSSIWGWEDDNIRGSSSILILFYSSRFAQQQCRFHSATVCFSEIRRNARFRASRSIWRQSKRRDNGSDLTSTQKKWVSFVIGSHGWWYSVIHRMLVRWSASACADPATLSAYTRCWSGYTNSETGLESSLVLLSNVCFFFK